MIAKRILSPKGGSGYQRLSGYVLNVSEEHRAADRPSQLDDGSAPTFSTPRMTARRWHGRGR